jgi:hypothetical protein
MAYVFLDESGDMGFDFTKRKTTRYFVITCVFTVKKRGPEKIIRRTVKRLPLKERMRHTGMLHAFKETDRIRKKILLDMAEQQDLMVVAICLDKRKVHTDWQSQKHALYTIVTNILLDRIYNKNLANGANVEIIASRRETKTVLNNEFKHFLEGQINRDHGVKVEVKIETPTKEKCLQLADFASWAIFRNREHGDDTYRNIIKPIIVEDISLLQ